MKYGIKCIGLYNGIFMCIGLNLVQFFQYYGFFEFWFVRLLNEDIYSIDLYLLWLENEFEVSKSGFGKINQEVVKVFQVRDDGILGQYDGFGDGKSIWIGENFRVCDQQDLVIIGCRR